MRLHRFIGEYNLNKDIIEIKDLDFIKQIKSVLRLELGDFLVLCDGKGTEAKVEIIQIEKSQITTKIIERTEKEQNLKKVSLYLSILKKENFELAVEKAVEIGVNEIIPVVTERTVKLNLNEERLKKIIREASEQSGRTILPNLSPIMKFEDAINDGKKNEEQIFFTLSLASYGVNIAEDGKAGEGIAFARKNSISIFIGPEGGLTKEEQDFAVQNDYKVESLGGLTLRAETAAIVATYKVLNS